MEINGHEYKFLYSVGAFIEIGDLKLLPPKTKSDQCKITLIMAEILSRAYENAKKINETDYKPAYLTRDILNALPIERVVKELMPEIDSAVAEGQYREIQTEETKGKNAESTANE